MNPLILLCSHISQQNTSDESIISSVFWNIIASVLFVGIVWLVQQFRYFFILRKPIHNKTYNVSYKRYGSETVMRVECKTKRNRIVFEGNVLDGGNNPKITGELIVNIINLRTAEGFSLQDGEDAFVFLNAILTEHMDTFYVEAHYTAVAEGNTTNGLGTKNKTCTIVPQAFVWRKELISERKTK